MSFRSNAQNWCFAHFKLLKAEFFFSHNILTSNQVQNIESTGPAIGLLVMDIFQFCCCFFHLVRGFIESTRQIDWLWGLLLSNDQNQSIKWMSVTQNNVHCLLTWHLEAYSVLKKNLFQLSLWTSQNENLLAWQENLPVLEDRTPLGFSPVNNCYTGLQSLWQFNLLCSYMYPDLILTFLSVVSTVWWCKWPGIPTMV